LWIAILYGSLDVVLPSDESTVAGLQQKRLNARDFDVIKVIGRGAFGEVQLVSMLIYSIIVKLSVEMNHTSLERCSGFRG